MDFHRRPADDEERQFNPRKGRTINASAISAASAIFCPFSEWQAGAALSL